MRRRLLLFVALACVVVGGLALLGGPAHAGAPKTLAERTPVGAAPVDPDFPVDFVGVLWDGAPDRSGASAVRFRHDDHWGAWIALGEDGVDEPGRFASNLVAADDADAYQVRVPQGRARPVAVAINTTDGPRPSRRITPAIAGAATAIVSRAAWGADESLRFDASGAERFPPEYFPPQKLTVHHTDTANNDVDPAATVRAIYRYHAVDRAFGDIGYHYLIAEDGRVFEGRWSGADGDPAHDPTTGNVVTGAHVGGWNSGNVGVALLGTLTSQAPKPSARSSLESLLADLAGRHAIAPTGSGTYKNPVNGTTWTGPNIPGHRDFSATECPGGALYALLPSVRSAVAARLSGTPTSTTSTTSTTAPSKAQKPRR
jgi:hypothetical protein